ncbi:15-O-acetyltransferase [Tricladium varicosporioides]|nr:15-O-acetyltransferase [Hymenoscyphus varicosporioides]
MTSSLPKLSPLVSERFRWHMSSTNASTLQRRGNGTEAWVGIKNENCKGQYDLYLLTTLHVCEISTATTMSLSTIKKEFSTALLEILFDHPDIACTAIWEGNDGPFIQYTSPASENDALLWASDSVQILATTKSALDVRMEIGKQRRDVNSEVYGKPSKSFTIYVITDVVNENTQLTPGTAVEVLMHMNHMYWDGISARMFAGELFRILGQNFGQRDKRKQHLWGEELANLEVPILDAMSLSVDSLENDFSSSRDKFLQSLMDFSSSWALEIGVESGIPCTIFASFTTIESSAIVRGIKVRLGPGYTISHLGHAATLLALLKTNPPPSTTPQIQKAIFPLPVNGRRYLQEKYSHTRYTSCQAPAVVEYDNLLSYVVNHKGEDAVVEALERGCRVAKKELDGWLKKPFLLAMGISKDNFLAASLSGPKDTPSENKTSERTVPIFISDGINDRFIPPDITVAATGEKLMEIDNVSFFLDSYLPGILIRMESWKGATSFSLCFENGSYSTEKATSFLKDLMGYMLTFAEYA